MGDRLHRALALMLYAVLAAFAGTATGQREPALRSLAVGALAIRIPADWKPTAPAALSPLRAQYVEQGKAIHRGTTGAEPSAFAVELVAFEFDNGGTFALAVTPVPRTFELVRRFRSEPVHAIMQERVRAGQIRQYLGLTAYNNGTVFGTYTRAVARRGGFLLSGELQHKDRDDLLINVSLCSHPATGTKRAPRRRWWRC